MPLAVSKTDIRSKGTTERWHIRIIDKTHKENEEQLKTKDDPNLVSSVQNQNTEHSNEFGPDTQTKLTL